MIIERPTYMKQLISALGTDQVKVITGIRRCGKSYLLFNLFKQYLLEQEIPSSNIFEMAFDRFSNKHYRDPNVFYPPHIANLISSTSGKRYILLDEVQLLNDFAEVLINLIARENVDVFVTGSNAKLLSHDVVTEFRERGQEIAMMPLSFSEFMSAYAKDKREGYIEYAMYGGLPGVLQRENPEEKTAYLNSPYDELYIRDIVERNGIRNQGNLEELIDVLSSGIGSPTNASKLAATLCSR